VRLRDYAAKLMLWFFITVCEGAWLSLCAEDLTIRCYPFREGRSYIVTAIPPQIFCCEWNNELREFWARERQLQV